jgi:hypothetical protein
MHRRRLIGRARWCFAARNDSATSLIAGEPGVSGLRGLQRLSEQRLLAWSVR